MSVWARTAAMLAMSILLMGSKVVIRVPAGGSVVSSSGLFACSAGEMCTIEINTRQFAETFTAVADPGYQFRHWGGLSGALCKGSSDPYCTELDNSVFSGFEPEIGGTSPPWQARDVMTMTPSFAGDRLRAEPESRFSVSSHHTTRYYEVDGNTQEEVWAQMRGPANPLSIDRDVGVKPFSYASFRYRYDYRSEYGASPSDCRVASGELDLEFETVLPELAIDEGTSIRLIERWRPFQQQITEHEAGHHAIYRRLVHQLPRALTDMGEVPCTELEDRVREAVADTVDTIRQASVDYHRTVGGEGYLASSI